MISIVVAMTKDRVIGKENALPWPKIKEDMDHFRTLTSGHSVIMGSKTYLSIPEKFRPLPKRNNIIISRAMEEQQGIDVVRSIDEALEKAQKYNQETFVIGGASIYEQTLSRVERMYLSLVKKEYSGDAYFPSFNEENWTVSSHTDFKEFELFVYDRR